MVWIGPISSLFDIATFIALWFVFHAYGPNQSLFQSGWFIESLLSQTLIVQSRASVSVSLLTSVIMAVGVYVPFSAIGSSVGLVPVPARFFPWLAAMLLLYGALTQLVKTAYMRRFHAWL